MVRSVDDCTQAEASQLDHMHRRGALICCKANKRTATTLLYKELNWDTLSQRRKYIKLTVMFKIVNNSAPKYLKDLIIPSNVETRSNYCTRNHRDVARTERMKKSVIPSSIVLWNNLGKDAAHVKYGNIAMFKAAIKSQPANRIPEKLFNCNVVSHSHVIAQLRMGLSSLKGQLYKYNIIKDGSCHLCGACTKDLAHYLLHCPAHANLINIQQSTQPSLVSKLTHGSPSNTSDKNINILSALHTFIVNSKRFSR